MWSFRTSANLLGPLRRCQIVTGSPVEHGPDLAQHVFRGERLLQEVGPDPALSQRPDPPGVAAHEEHLEARARLSESGRKSGAAEAGKRHVGEEEVDGGGRYGQLERFLPGAHREDAVAAAGQETRHEVAYL